MGALGWPGGSLGMLTGVDGAHDGAQTSPMGSSDHTQREHLEFIY